MKSENVCKFSLTRSSDLICLNFIKETENAQSKSLRAEANAIHLVLCGKGVYWRNGKRYEIGRGSLFFVCEGDEFSIFSEDALQYFYISFRGRRAEELALRFSLSDGGVFSEYEALIPFWEECNAAAEDGNIDILCESVLLYSLAKLKPAKKEQNDAVSRVILLTQERFSKKDISLPRIAKEIGYDPKYLSALFKKKKGIAYTRYLREMRIKHAIFLMEQGVVSVKNVALLSGFGDALYFSKVFTEAMGISPKTYIQGLQNDEESKTKE